MTFGTSVHRLKEFIRLFRACGIGYAEIPHLFNSGTALEKLIGVVVMFPLNPRILGFMENDTLLRNFAWLCFLSNTLCVFIAIDFVLFKKLYLTSFVLTFFGVFYFNYKFFLFFRAGHVLEKLAGKNGIKLCFAFFSIYFAYLFFLLFPEVIGILSRLKQRGKLFK